MPFAAISAFADPSVNFALQFQVGDEAVEPSDFTDTPVPNPDAPESDGKVVTLDQFRKK